ASQEPLAGSLSEGQTLPNFIPLFIAVAQDGDGYPSDQLLSGLTALPNPMAIGATWQPDLAERVGLILGKELSALGFNLLLGPSLDLLELPKPESPGDLGTRTFGGDPFWVGEMGRAFIRGVHLGSQNRLAVVAKHFPGQGGSDRLPEEEVATVRESLEQLKQMELAPFFAVTGGATNPESTTDALLNSHIRYQGFQGNIRATTRPISFDPQAFAQLMSLTPFATWRQDGGVVVTDDLGSRAVRRFYDPSGISFNARLIARDAFLVGNDLLYLGDFIEPGDPDAYTTISRTLSFFAQKYREDPAFAQRVDESVLRLLTLKFKLYGTFTLDAVLPPEEGLNVLGQGNEATFLVASQAATLISPPPEDLESSMPAPPDLQDRIVFLTDTYTAVQCSGCVPKPVMDTDSLQQAVLRLYGPRAGGLVVLLNLESYTFNDLLVMLESERGTTQLERSLQQADWIVFSMLDVRADRPASLALRQFLAGRPDLTRNKPLIVFAFNAPYYLDATEISHLTAYFGLYSRSKPFVEVAARLLYKELLLAPGALPVSVSGVGYDLISATAPDPDQVIPLFFDFPEVISEGGTITPEPTATPAFKVGDLIPVRTGIILDHNGHPVPDGTVVKFSLVVSGEGVILRELDKTTVGGIARVTFSVDTAKRLEVRALSEPAIASATLVIEVPVIEGEVLPTTTPGLTPGSPESPVVETEVVSVPISLEPIKKQRTDLADWGLAVLIAGGLGWLTYQQATRKGQIRWGLYSGLSAVVGALAGYTYLAFNAPGVQPLLAFGGRWIVVGFVLVCAISGWGVTLVFRLLQRDQKEKAE
ncbi:MAG: glycoside hydrolase family 3 N-terminal domain-containing protein, partial [Chloroflexota bacterium]